MWTLVITAVLFGQMPVVEGMEHDDIMLLSLRSPRILKELNLSQEQMKKIDEIHYGYASKIVDLRAGIQKRSLDLNRIVMRGDFTREDIEPILKEIASMEAELRINRLMEIQEIKKVLTKEQNDRLRELIRKEMESRRKKIRKIIER
jgi:Spy/CpxP family protein refolding chaperone